MSILEQEVETQGAHATRAKVKEYILTQLGEQPQVRVPVRLVAEELHINPQQAYYHVRKLIDAGELHARTAGRQGMIFTREAVRGGKTAKRGAAAETKRAARSDTKTLFCPWCGKDNEHSYKFCMGCGKEIPHA